MGLHSVLCGVIANRAPGNTDEPFLCVPCVANRRAVREPRMPMGSVSSCFRTTWPPPKSWISDHRGFLMECGKKSSRCGKKKLENVVKKARKCGKKARIYKGNVVKKVANSPHMW